MAEKESRSLIERLVPILLLASIAMAFLVGVLWQKVSSLESGGSLIKTPQKAANSGGNPSGDAPEAPNIEQGKMSEEQAKKIAKVDNDDHIKGGRDAKVFLIEYSDYQCPFCARFHPTAQRIVEEFKGQVAWVFRHFPLDAIHPKARPAANAAECVAKLGGEDAFWKFTDTIFADQTGTLDNLGDVAEKAGVKTDEFKSCLDSQKYNNLVDKDIEEGTQAGVRGTPGNFIVNQKGEAWFVPGAYPYDQIKPYIEEALK